MNNKTNINIGILLFATSISLSLIISTQSLRGNWWASTLQKMRLRNRNTLKANESNTLNPIIQNYGVLLISKDFIEDNHNDSKSSWRSISSFDDENDEELMQCEIEVVNDFGKVLLFCWISNDGILCHHYPINDGSIVDGSVSNRHIEYTRVNHAFVCYVAPRESSSNIKKLPETLQDIDINDLVFIYQPKKGQYKHMITVSKSLQVCEVHLKAEILNSKVIDTSHKNYEQTEIGGFKVHYELNLFENLPQLKKCLSDDFEIVSALIPYSILQTIQGTTCFWLNENITFGTESRPIIGRSCTYHSKDGQAWLKRNGLNILKAGSIEIYCCKEYLNSRNYWGNGGILVHELMHCIHDKLASHGYDCLLIQDAYQKAMMKKLYDAVPVHGPQGKDSKMVKAYACTNCMEFFAELSVAYLWKKDDTTEYNKWFPHNRYQLKQHDEETFLVFDSFWKALEESLNNN